MRMDDTCFEVRGLGEVEYFNSRHDLLLVTSHAPHQKPFP